jgi:hypothetical protein
MYLAELIKEKDYVESSIYDLRDHILHLAILKDKSDYKENKFSLDQRLKELEALHLKYQQFSVSIERAKSKTKIKVNDTELSLTDAITLKESLEYKLQSLEYILDTAIIFERKGEGILIVDSDGLFDLIEETRLDIKTIESQIDMAIWKTEVK